VSAESPGTWSRGSHRRQGAAQERGEDERGGRAQAGTLTGPLSHRPARRGRRLDLKTPGKDVLIAPGHRLKRRNPAFFRHSGGNNCHLRRRGHAQKLAHPPWWRCVGHMGRAEPLWRRVMTPLLAPPRRTVGREGKVGGGPACSALPVAASVSRPVPLGPNVRLRASDVNDRPKTDALSEKNVRAPRKERSWVPRSGRGRVAR
jgi:hypothetical protein